MDLNLVNLFLAVAEEESLSRAARKLNLPVSSISRAITRLEEKLQTQLLVRTTRRVTRTPAGDMFYRRVAPLMSGLHAELNRIAEREEILSGTLRLTAPVELGSAFLADCLARFTARYPDIHVYAHLTNEVIDLVAERFDIALRISSGNLRGTSLVAKRIQRLVGHLYASPTYLARRGHPKTISDLSHHDWVVFTNLRTLILNSADGVVRISPRGRIAATEILGVREFVRAGLGIGFLPFFLAAPEVASGALVRVLPSVQLLTGSLWFVRPATSHVPRRVTAFRDFLFDYLRTRLSELSLSER